MQYLLLFFLILALFFDLRSRKVPNMLILIGMLSSILLNYTFGTTSDLLRCLYGGILGLTIFYIPYSKGLIGAADTKLFAMVGMFLGPTIAVWAFIFSCLSGGVVAILFAIRQRCLKKSLWNIYQCNDCKMTIPYVIAIFIGACMSILNLQRLLH